VSQLSYAQTAFSNHFGSTPTIQAIAPGRVNLIGEHTDYNEGFVLPMALDRATLFVGKPNGTQTARLLVPAWNAEASIDLSQPVPRGEPSWSNYVRGVLAGFQSRGASLQGFDAVIHSDVPVGGGLSSSAALEVSAALFCEALTGLKLSPPEMALLCQQAEHSHAGVPCGVMDQFISRCGRAGHALLLDCASLETRHIPFADDTVSLLIINTMVKHALADGTYAKRRATCESVARTLGHVSLRTVKLPELTAANLDEESIRRARHVITEIERTLRAADCLAAGDWSELGDLMHASHASLRDDYEVSCTELDWLVDHASQIPSAFAVYGARMTGGGFGGSMIVLAATEQIESVRSELVTAYANWSGKQAESLISKPSEGARLL
jgi:galactokinase